MPWDPPLPHSQQGEEETRLGWENGEESSEEKSFPQLLSKSRAGSSKCFSPIRNPSEGWGALMKMKHLEDSNRGKLPGIYFILFYKCSAEVGAVFIRQMFSASFWADSQFVAVYGQRKWQGEFLALQQLLRALLAPGKGQPLTHTSGFGEEEKGKRWQKRSYIHYLTAKN